MTSGRAGENAERILEDTGGILESGMRQWANTQNSEYQWVSSGGQGRNSEPGGEDSENTGK